jgi:hypothetical protein
MPIDSLCASVPTWPFFVVKSRCRKCITRTSPYDAPRVFAVSSALVQKSHMVVAQKENSPKKLRGAPIQTERP